MCIKVKQHKCFTTTAGLKDCWSEIVIASRSLRQNGDELLMAVQILLRLTKISTQIFLHRFSTSRNVEVKEQRFTGKGIRKQV